MACSRVAVVRESDALPKDLRDLCVRKDRRHVPVACNFRETPHVDRGPGRRAQGHRAAGPAGGGISILSLSPVVLGVYTRTCVVYCRYIVYVRCCDVSCVMRLMPVAVQRARSKVSDGSTSRIQRQHHRNNGKPPSLSIAVVWSALRACDRQ
jgi:hypothetical protein